MSADLGMRRLPVLAVLALAVVGDVRHRARAVQRHGGDQVLEAGRAASAAARRACPGLRTGTRRRRRRAPASRRSSRRPAAAGRDRPRCRACAGYCTRALQDRQRGQAQEVELHQPRLLDVFHRVLRDQHVGSSDRGRAAPARSAAGRRSPRRRHACWRGGTGPRAAARFPAGGAPPRRRRASACSRGSPSIACCSVTGLAGLFGISSATRLTCPNGRPSTRPDVAHRRARLQLAEGDDLRHPVGAVFAPHVGDHLVAPVLAEIDVEIRHRHALGIEEPLEQQAEAQRVEIGDGQRPGRHRAGTRAAARPTGMPCAFAHWMKSATIRK